MKTYARIAFRVAAGAYVLGAGALVIHEWRFGLDAENRLLAQIRDTNRERDPAVTVAAIEKLKASFPERGQLEEARAVFNGRLLDTDRSKAEANLRKLVAIPGDTGVKAQFALAMALIDSSRPASEQADGIVLLRQAAEAGEGRAQTAYANLLVEGTRVPRDLKLARDYYIDAAKKVPEAALSLAQLYGGESLPSPNSRSREDLARHAVELLKEDSDSGNLTSTLKLADILSGADEQVADLIPFDIAEAEKRYALAADAGSGIAVVKLALLLRDKISTPEARERASGLLRKAADSGSGEALLELGKGYRDGLYGNPDPVEAFNFYRRASEAGLTGGMVLLGKAYMAGEGVAVDTKVGMDWVRRAADGGNPAAKVELGVIHHRGILVPRDDKAAFDWYLAGAKAGNGSGMAAVARAKIAQHRNAPGNGFLTRTLRDLEAHMQDMAGGQLQGVIRQPAAREFQHRHELGALGRPQALDLAQVLVAGMQQPGDAAHVGGVAIRPADPGAGGAQRLTQQALGGGEILGRHRPDRRLVQFAYRVGGLRVRHAHDEIRPGPRRRPKSGDRRRRTAPCRASRTTGTAPAARPPA